MIEHPTGATTRRASDEAHTAHATGHPTDDTTATFVDLVCADRELLRAEFDSIIAANVPGSAGAGQRLVPADGAPTATVTTATTPPPPRHRLRARPGGHLRRDRGLRAHHPRARSPPSLPRSPDPPDRR